LAEQHQAAEQAISTQGNAINSAYRATVDEASRKTAEQQQVIAQMKAQYQQELATLTSDCKQQLADQAKKVSSSDQTTNELREKHKKELADLASHNDVLQKTMMSNQDIFRKQNLRHCLHLKQSQQQQERPHLPRHLHHSLMMTPLSVKK